MTELVGIVLAAGLGTRFEDGNKLLATVGGEPIVSRAARSFTDGSVDRTVAVLGHDASAVRDEVGPRVDETVTNDEHERGQSRSVRLGARRAREVDADGALFLPGDMPCVSTNTVRLLANAYENDAADPRRKEAADAFVPTHDGRRGNPVLFDSAQFDDLTSLSGDVGGRSLFETIDVHRVPTDDPGIHLDVDTVDDLERVRQFDRETGRS